MNILVAKNGSQLGPFSEGDIRTKLASGELAPSDLGWKEGMPAWSPLSLMFAAAPPAAVPAAPAAPAQPTYSPQVQGNPGTYSPQPQAYSQQGQPQNYSPQPNNAPQGQYSAPQTYNSPYPSPYPQQNPAQPWGAPGFSGYAGFWLRVVAVIIDTIVLNIVMFIVGFIIGLVIGATHMMNQDSMVVIIYLISFVVNWLYYAVLESSAAQGTLGKQALSIKVTDLNGARIGFGQATGRFFGKSILALCTLGISLIMAGFTERKQTLHDMVTSTLVVRK